MEIESPEKPSKASAFTKAAFSVALALLLMLMLSSISRHITPPPEFSDQPYPDVNSEEACAEAGGRWVTGATNQPRNAAVPTEAPEISSYCQGPLTFERERKLQSAASEQTSMFTFAIGGALAVVASLMAKSLRPVAPGLLLGGVFSFLVAGFHVWILAPGLGRLATIIAIFVVMVVLGLHVFKAHK